jgi:hypothetical protein
MSTAKKPDAPKFEPVVIPGYRREVYALGTPEAERKAMLAEDGGRMVLARTVTALERLTVLQKYLGLSGKLGEEGNMLVMLISVANKYVPGFEVKVGPVPKRGAKKVGDRFKTVTEIEGMKFQRDLPTIALAIEAVAADRRPAIRPPELSTKYYACLREIEANLVAALLLKIWRLSRDRAPRADSLQEFDSLFWECERDFLGAVRPHNVTPLRSR